MKLFHHVHSLRAALNGVRAQGLRIGFVPTMGNLHDAHLALIRKAQAHSDIVVASIFVNRMQFGLNEDWDRYPRTLESDVRKLKAVNCNILFCPDEHEIYPNGMDTQTRVIVPTMANVLCGASRPGHFEGVTTVVAKLFNIVQPDLAVFGLKDYQQLAIIRRMVEDLCLPIELLPGEIYREEDGLAMSSRNSFITQDERPKAGILYQSLNWLKDQILSGNRDFVALELEAVNQIESAGFCKDYVSVCEAKTLEPAAIDDINVIVLGAMFSKKARLIDNVAITLTRPN